MESRKRPRGEEEGDGEAAGEISLSVEETNKLRISLGLKPLEAGGAKQDDEGARRHRDEQAKRAKEERARQFVAKQAEKKRQNKVDAFLDVKGLGEPDEEEDMHTWVEKNRVADVARRAEESYAKRQAAAEAARKAEQAGGSDEEEGGEGRYTASDLAGMKVRHGYDDLTEGETMVLTLADRGLLDEKGNALDEANDDELINVLKNEDKTRRKARDAAAPKAKPLWEEDGIKRGLLEKYDQEEAEMALQLGADGSLEAAAMKRKEEVKRKLAEGGKLLETAAVGLLAPKDPAGPAATANGGAGGDYYTEAEMEVKGFKKRKEKKGKKERKLRERAPEDDGDTSALIEQLEAAAQQQGSGQAGGADLGARGSRLGARERAAAALREQEVAKRAKFEDAVERGNWASQALRQKVQEALIVGEEDLESRELQESLERARRLANKQKQKEAATNGDNGMAVDGEGSTASGAGGAQLTGLEGIAASAAKARDEDEARLKEELAAAAKLGKDQVVNDTIEFVRNIQANASAAAHHAGTASVMGSASRVPPPPPGGPPGTASAAPRAEKDKDDYMDIDEDDMGQQAGWTSTAGGAVQEGKWTSDEAAAAGGGRAGRQFRKKAEGGDEEGAEGDKADEGQEESGIGDVGLGKGLAATLALLKERGELGGAKHLTWAGRTNDRSKNALQGLIGDVYAGGAHEERLARSIEAALTTKDEFGRVMTPKERFRHLCYDFHGKKPSKNKEETRLKKAAEEIARRKNATSEVAGSEGMEGLEKVTEKVAQPYIVLQGKGAMESLKAMTGATGSMGPPPSKKPGKSNKPAPPGNLTPLLGDRKVEAMLNIRKESPSGKLPPPPGGPRV